MKFKTEHYNELKTAIDIVTKNHPNAMAEYAEAGMSARRYRWDLLWASKYKIPYNEYNDSHVDTALRAITQTK